jgi:hypothetical protein
MVEYFDLSGASSVISFVKVLNIYSISSEWISSPSLRKGTGEVPTLSLLNLPVCQEVLGSIPGSSIGVFSTRSLFHVIHNMGFNVGLRLF